MKLKFLLGVALIPLNLNAMNESADEVDYIQINFPETNSDSPVVSTVILDENFDRLSKAVHNAETDTIRKDALEAVHFFIDSCLVPNSYGLPYNKLKEVNLWEVYCMLMPRPRQELEKKYKNLWRAPLR